MPVHLAAALTNGTPAQQPNRNAPDAARAARNVTTTPISHRWPATVVGTPRVQLPARALLRHYRSHLEGRYVMKEQSIHEPVDWHDAATRQHQYNRDLIYTALGDVGPLDGDERRFISQIAWDGGHLQLASLLRKARQAAPAPASSQPDDAIAATEVAEPPAGPSSAPLPDTRRMLNDHVNDIGDWCPWSQTPVGDDYPHRDGRCPQACRASRIVEREG